MSDEFGKDKTDVEKLDQIGRLVDKYAQSRSLGLLIPVAILGTIVALIIGTTELTDWKLGGMVGPIPYLVDAGCYSGISMAGGQTCGPVRV